VTKKSKRKNESHGAPKVTEQDQIGALGVTHVQLAVEKLGWIFRRVDHRDTGLDAEVEVVLAGEATGLVLGLQIKTGSSYFSAPTARGWKYRGDYEHLQYWRDHNLAVVVVLVDHEHELAYWESVGGGTKVHEAARSWTIEVPREKKLSKESATHWMDLAFAANPRDALYRYCVLQTRYIELLAAGGRIFVEARDWVNKTRGQAELRVILDDQKGTITEESLFIFAGVYELHGFVQSVFPWADISVDEEFYEENEYVQPEAVFPDEDSETGYFEFPGEKPTGIRAYGDEGGGEVALYRFELTLNHIGNAFAVLSAAAGELSEYPPYYLARGLARKSE
jgi:hypothetical protein